MAIQEYSEYIKKHNTSKYILLLFKYINNGLKKNQFYFDEKKSNKAIKFIENFCHHSEGSSGLLKLELWQKAIVSCIFGIVDEQGKRIFQEVFIVVARKNGKTLFASAIIAYVVFLQNEFGTKVYCVAPKLEQADLVFNAFKNTCELEPDLKVLIKSRKTDLYVSDSKSSIKKIAFNAKTSDGFNPSLVVCDEVSSWSGDKGLKQYEVMKSALGARQEPLILSITTAGYVNDSIYDELMKRSTRFLNGDSKEKKLLPFLYVIDDVDNWDDFKELEKSNPNLDISVSKEYLKEEVVIAKESLSKKAEFLTKYCNIKQNSSQAWLMAQDIEKCGGKHLNIEDFKGCYCVGGIDLSQTTDLTSCCVLIEKNDVLYYFGKFFMPENKIDEATARDGVPYRIYQQRGLLESSGENYVDYESVYNWFKQLLAMKIYPLKVGYDRYSSQYLVQQMKSEGFHMDDVFQGENLTPVIRELEGIVKDRKLNIGDNDLMKLHLYNSGMKVNAETSRMRLIKIGQTDRIDGTAALLDALCVKQKYSNEIGAQIKNGNI